MSCQHTFHSLHDWTKSKFEHLGWMILSKKEGLTYKIQTYKKNLQHLKKALEEKIKITEENDRKTDLKVLLENVVYLQEFVSKHL